MPSQIELTKAWGSYPKSQTLDVLEPGEAIRPLSVDRGRAATLCALRLARAIDLSAPIDPGADPNSGVATPHKRREG